MERHGSFSEKELIELLEKNAGTRDFSQRLTYPYMLGVYLGVNAIADAFLLVEGPDCTYMKAQFLQGNHDWLSTLTSVSGFHRITNTALHPSMISEPREEPVREKAVRIASYESCGGLLLTSMPMAFVTGADYDRLCRQVSSATGKDVVHVPGLSLSGDWLDGYAQTMIALARSIPLSPGLGQEKDVAVVGYLYDRNEEDHKANIEEIRAMCAAAGLNLVSVWFQGQPFADLRMVERASTIIALPYGGKAARIISKKTDARVLDLPVPFGLQACETWMMRLQERFDSEKSAAEYMDRAMQEIAPKIEWLIPYLFQNLNAGYVGDPHLLKGLTEILDLVGARLLFAVITNRKAHLTLDQSTKERVEILSEPRLNAFIHFMAKNVLEKKVKLLITNTMGLSLPFSETAVVEFGFPSAYTHALYKRPFLGYGGFMAFMDGIANALRQNELMLSRPVLGSKKAEEPA